jgi:hypothetical protein
MWENNSGEKKKKGKEKQIYECINPTGMSCLGDSFS